MQKDNLLKINLLPADFLAAQREYRKFHKIQIACISLILIFVFLASLTVALRVFQTQRVNAAQSQLEENTTRVSTFKDKEAQLLVLKNRLGTIQKLVDNPSKQRQIYNLVNQLIPPQMVISVMNIDSGGNVSISLVAQDINTLQSFIDNLLSPERNEGLVERVEMENLSRSRDSLLRTSMVIISN